MPTLLENWDPAWDNDVDNKTYTLKRWIDDLNADSHTHTNQNTVHDVEIANLKTSVNELLLYHKLRMLYELEKIDKKELRRLYEMLTSPDEENHVLVHQLIETIK